LSDRTLGTMAPLRGQQSGREYRIARDTDQDLYLELLKQCLSRSIFGERFKPLLKPRSVAKWKWLWWHVVYPTVERVLSRVDLELVRKAHFDRQACQNGFYYHSEAESMIGITGLNNVQNCVTDCLRRGVPGDLLEAGVWRGGTTILMRAVLLAYGDADRKVWVADSFEGCPKPQDPSEHTDRHWFNNFLCVPLEQVRANFERYGLLDDRVIFLPGWFAESLPNAPIHKLAVLRVDADMYSSTLDVLHALYGKVSKDGYVIIDDYFTIEACRRAVDEFRAARNIKTKIQNVDDCRAFWQVEDESPLGDLL
jgi:O-methyltransferase